MAGGPRKFSEKIALLNQKEAEGNAAFDSIMVEVKAIRPSGSNSGSQLDMLDTECCLTDKTHSTIEETIGYNESVNVTYMSERQQKQQQQALALQFQLQQHTKQTEQQNHSLLNKNNEQQQQQSILANQSYLQLPNQNDSFRRAHSDSSLNQSVSSNASNSSAQLGVIFQQQEQQQQQQQQNAYQQQPPQMIHHQYQQQPLQFQPQFQNQQQQLYQSQQPQQQNMYQQQQQQTPFIQGTNEYNAIPFRNLSLPITSSLLPASPTNFGQLTGPTSPITNAAAVSSSASIKSEPKVKNLSSPTKSVSPTAALSPTLISPHHIKNVLNQQQQQQQQNTNQFIYPANIQQQQQQQHHQQQYQQQSFQQQSQINADNHLLSPTSNTNFLNANIQNTAGGSLPDLTSFQFQQTQSHQMMQLQDYNNKRQQQQHQQQLHEQVYEFSPQMLQPNFQQHNHIGPVKPTHSNSVSPVRGASRYSPTHSNSNLSSISNRRSSPQQLGLNKQPLISNTSAQSSPTSPLHPSVQTFPALEFTINSYMPSSPNNIVTASSSNNNIVYRTNSASTCTTQGAESLPPSPQSQHSCFNSPQGSPGPISISPADLNPFTSNNYDIMQKKFDSINLETSNSFKGYLPNGVAHMYGQYSPATALSPTSPTAPNNQGLILSPRSPNSPGTNMQQQHGKALNSKGSVGDLLHHNNNNGHNKAIDNKHSNSNDNLSNLNNTSNVAPIINTLMGSNDNLKNLNLEKSAKTMNGKIDRISLDEIGTLHKHLINNNCNNNISNNNINNGINTNEIEIDQMYNPHVHMHHQQQQQQQQQTQQLHHHHHHHHLQHHNSDISNVIIKTMHNPDNNKIVHKNSIPNIIFTFSGDSTDDKNDNILKEMSNDLIYNDDLLMNKNEQFDLDLQMLSDSVENNNNCNGIYQNT